MDFQKPNSSYWDEKLAAYLHDPIDKVFDVRKHEERAAKLLEVFGIQKPNDKFWIKADCIAAGFERGQVPSYSPDKSRNGAVDFLSDPILTHPTSNKAKVIIKMDKSVASGADEMCRHLLDFIAKCISEYSDRFRGDPERFSFARFLYTHLVLRFLLAKENVSGIGALWHRLPADSRFPDHSIWQHNALTSALYSCMTTASDPSQIGIMIFSITPVQGFIATARKLRDYWTGSILLSWLAFEGIKWVVENLGPDHILYPSLIDQPLVNRYLEKTLRTGKFSSCSNARDVASLPNKFLFLLPFELASVVGKSISECLQNTWSELSNLVLEAVLNTVPSQSSYLKELFQRQNSNFWTFDWSVAKLLTRRDHTEFSKLLPKDKFNNQLELIEIFDKVSLSRGYSNEGEGFLYSVTHSLVQGVLAAQKNRRKNWREHEPGEKCHMCGEFEVLHSKKHRPGTSARQYKSDIRNFWQEFKKNWGPQLDFDENERLCSICLIKRIAYRVLEKVEDHILHETFKGIRFYPSTTELALYNYFKRYNITEPKEKHRLAQQYHEDPNEKTENRDSYYAILLMDGDKMGDLVCGKNLASTWESVMHPQLASRIQAPDFDHIYRDVWKTIFEEYNQRLLTPAIHSAISESLGDFSLYGVTRIVSKYDGKLIYAGGDDVCAVFPVDTVLDAAREIKQYYNSSFKLICENGTTEIKETWSPQPGKLSVLLGDEEENGISISAGILICHHKENLSLMLEEAHKLLKEKAKEGYGRNCCAIQLRKRGGGSRFFIRKWNSSAWSSFKQVGLLLTAKNNHKVSMSLVYRLERYRYGIEAILKREDYERLLINFVKKQLDRTMIGHFDKADEDLFEEVAKKMVDIMVFTSSNGCKVYEPEGLIIAAFIADKGGGN